MPRSLFWWTLLTAAVAGSAYLAWCLLRIPSVSPSAYKLGVAVGEAVGGPAGEVAARSLFPVEGLKVLANAVIPGFEDILSPNNTPAASPASVP
jgi:hypothetical protein